MAATVCTFFAHVCGYLPPAHKKVPARPRLWGRQDGRLFVFFSFVHGNQARKSSGEQKHPMCFCDKVAGFRGRREGRLGRYCTTTWHLLGATAEGGPSSGVSEKRRAHKRKNKDNGDILVGGDFRHRRKYNRLPLVCFIFCVIMMCRGKAAPADRARHDRPQAFSFPLSCGRSYCSRGQQKSKLCRRFSTPSARIPLLTERGLTV